MATNNHNGEELSEQTAQCALMDGNNEDVNPEVLDQFSKDDAGNKMDINYTGDDEEKRWLEEGGALVLSRQKELATGTAVLRGGIGHQQDCRTTFLFASCLADKHWPIVEGFSLEDAKKAIDGLEKIPYMSDCLREDLARAKQILDSVSSEKEDAQTALPDVRLSSEQEQILASLPNESQRQACREQFLLSAEEKHVLQKENHVLQKEKQLHEKLYVIRGAIAKTLIQVQWKTHEVHNQLLYFAGMSQAEKTATHTSTAGDSVSKRQKMEKRSELFVVAEPARIVEPVLANWSHIEKALPNLCQVANTNEKAAGGARLKKVAEVIDNYLKKASFLQFDAADYKGKVTAAVKCLRSEIRSALNAGSTEQQKCNTYSESATMYAPGPTAHEVDGAQQWIQLLFQSIGACWEPSSSMADSPSKISLQKEAYIPNTDFRLKRSMDFLLRKEGRWEAVIFDDMLTVPVEVKPGCRGTKSSKNPKALLEEAAEQVYSHFAKHIFIGFNFASYGVPCHITGIVVCMGAIQILHLRYESVGTPEASLVLYKSGYLPLMTATIFQKWAKASGNEGQFDELKTDLYGPDGKEGMDDDQIPKGIRALFNLMDKPSKDLYGLSIDVQESNSQMLGKPLGSGASAIVFENLTQSSVVKLSRYGFKQGIENERKILEHLSKGCINLPQLVDGHINQACILNIKLGSVGTPLPAIELSPLGKNASAYLMQLSGGKDTEGGLKLILAGITSALEYMHQQKICHCDVTPKNIIIASRQCRKADPCPRAVLIDFSISMASDDSIMGFVGTPDYVHRNVFWFYLQSKKRRWNPQPGYDKAGLGFSLAFFANNCVRPWDANQPRSIKNANQAAWNEAMEERLTAAQNVISAIKDADLKSDILSLLAYDESMSEARAKL